MFQQTRLSDILATRITDRAEADKSARVRFPLQTEGESAHERIDLALKRRGYQPYRLFLVCGVVTGTSACTCNTLGTLTLGMGVAVPQ
jgi:hypothetical protein